MDRFITTGEDLATASRSQFNEFWGKEEAKSPSGWVDIEDIADTATPNPEEAMLIAEAEAEAEAQGEAARFILALRGEIEDSTEDVLGFSEEDDGNKADEGEILQYTSSLKYSGTHIGSRKSVQSKMF